MPTLPDFSIEARIPDEVESRQGVPDWCELMVHIGPAVEEDASIVMPHNLYLTRAAGELLSRTIGDVLHPWAGKSIIEHIWDDLDDVMDGLMDGSDAGEAAKGSALGLAAALARMYNPTTPNVDAIREEAMDRWTERHADDEEQAYIEADLEAEDAEEDVPFS